MATKRKRKAMSGGAKLKAAGKMPILLGVTPQQMKLFKKAAGLEMRPVTQWVIYHACHAAARLLAPSRHPREVKVANGTKVGP